MVKYSNVDDYLEKLDDQHLRAINQYLNVIQSISGNLEAKISYNTLFIYYLGKRVCYFNVTRKRFYLGLVKGHKLTSYLPELQGDTKVIKSIDLVLDPDPEQLDVVRTAVVLSIELPV